MRVIFSDKALEEIYQTGTTKDRTYKKLVRDRRFIDAYRDVVDTLVVAENTSVLRQISSLHYEKLKYRPESSVRIDNGRVERLLFTEHEGEIKIRLIEINTTHYGNKR